MNDEYYLSKKNLKSFERSLRRKRKEIKRKAGFKKFIDFLRKRSKQTGKDFNPPEYRRAKLFDRLGPKPAFSDNITFLASLPGAFAPDAIPTSENGIFEIPETFSLSDNYAESFVFLKRLFFVLYKQNTTIITIDYSKCKHIDVDASVCMDILLVEFIQYFNKCTRRGHKVRIYEITPINFDKPEIKKILFSIGAFRNLKGVRIEYPDIEPFPLTVGDKLHPNRSGIKEIHETQIVDYVLKCLSRMNRSLTWKAEKDISKVIGEIITNAEDHSDTRFRFAIGNFQETKGDHVGVFSLVIMNFGRTIYDTFKDPNCPNQDVVNRMKQLSDEYTKRGLFSPAEFEEQTLWTLYALQEGVTSKAYDEEPSRKWKRGNGSIRFIESFFNLKGNSDKDMKSNLIISSGNSRIVFDGTYSIIEKPRGGSLRPYKLMTFNKTGNIEDRPDKNFVKFTEYYFPGTILTAKIFIGYNNVEPIENGDD